MQAFIYWLRLLATLLITNSHFGNIWPISGLATGGLLGNVIFFAASGFCLYRVRERFPVWYGRRFLRIYPIVAVFTLFAVLIGCYPVRSLADATALFLYPTNYIFVVWILLLYIPFYTVAYLDKRFGHFTECALAATAVLWLITYVLFLDKSYYHIDDVSSPFICFVYFAAMLIGALFKKHEGRIVRARRYTMPLLALSLCVYFGTKLAFSRLDGAVLLFQPVNQLTLIFALVMLFMVLMGEEQSLGRAPRPVAAAVRFVSGITLHIYVVQFLIIGALEGLPFPLNFVTAALAIFAAASVLYILEQCLRKGIAALFKKIKSKRSDA